MDEKDQEFTAPRYAVGTVRGFFGGHGKGGIARFSAVAGD
jgi:hypothetical protein